MNTIEISVHPANMKEFGERLAKLNRKALKLNAGQIHVLSKVDTLVPEVLANGRKVHRRLFVINLEMPAIKLSGYEFAAKLENITGVTNIVHKIPGSKIEVDQRFRSTGTLCEHCNQKRYRKDVFVVQKESTGQQIQVGRQCLKDYLGHDATHQLSMLKYLAAAQELGESSSYGGGAWRDYDTYEILALTAAYMDKFGWTSKSGAEISGNEATIYRVLAHYSYDAKTREKANRDMPEIPTTAYAKADATIAFVSTMNAYGDYELNVQTLLGEDFVTAKNAGTVASAISMMDRKLGKIAEQKAKLENAKASEFVGTNGERLRGLKVTIQNVKLLESQFGTTTLISMIDTSGNQLTWFASGYVKAQRDDILIIDGTVKDQKLYNGQKQTILSRVKLKQAPADMFPEDA